MILAADLKSHSKEWLFFCIGCVFLTALVACGGEPRELVQLAGSSMGTSWHVSIVPATHIPDDAELQRGIEDVLEEVNRSMSTYREDSEISRFNTAAADTWVPVSRDFYAVLSTALAIGWQSEGAYDVTVAPLVDLWGFGPAGPVRAPPTDDAVTDLLEQVGQDQLRLDGQDLRVMKRTALTLDFSSIAKGYAVDRIALWLTGQGLDRYLVEVGGEMRLSGMSARGDPWRIAIEQPDSAARSVGDAVRLTDVAVATSGDYRNFFEVDGKRYSHSIDPRSGYPVAHDLVSVTVVERSAMLADAWATALTVLGVEQGMAVAQAQGLAVYFIRRQGREFKRSYSPAFEQFLETGGQGN